MLSSGYVLTPTNSVTRIDPVNAKRDRRTSYSPGAEPPAPFPLVSAERPSFATTTLELEFDGHLPKRFAVVVQVAGVADAPIRWQRAMQSCFSLAKWPLTEIRPIQ